MYYKVGINKNFKAMWTWKIKHELYKEKKMITFTAYFLSSVPLLNINLNYSRFAWKKISVK